MKKTTLVCSLVQKVLNCWLQFILKAHSNYMKRKNTVVVVVVVGIKTHTGNLTCHEYHIILRVTTKQVKLYNWQ
jgi:hypothetical protein